MMMFLSGVDASVVDPVLLAAADIFFAALFFLLLFVHAADRNGGRRTGRGTGPASRTPATAAAAAQSENFDGRVTRFPETPLAEPDGRPELRPDERTEGKPQL